MVGLLAISISAVTAHAHAQQTIFNVPNADVLEKGKVYLEEDDLWRPRDPNFAVFTARGVYGFGGHVEAGVNVGGFTTPGRSIPVATPNVKWQPWSSERLSVTTGVSGLFFLRGSKDGNPAALGYAHVAGKIGAGTRVTAGGYWASSGYAALAVQKGALAGIEQKIGGNWTFAADWFSGRNGLGYLTSGLIWGSAPWTVYGGYSVKNADSRGNAALVEFGFTF